MFTPNRLSNWRRRRPARLAAIVQTVLVLSVVLSLSGCVHQRSADQFELLFLNATVIDGTGAPRFLGDVAVRDGRIAKIGSLKKAVAVETIDLTGLVLSPGFIDVHSHADKDAVEPNKRFVKGFITQGVTTSVFGIDGEVSLADIQQRRQIFEVQGIGTNFMYYIGHNGVRRAVMGNEARKATPEETAQMAVMVREAMGNGAVGLSSGLMYLPGSHADSSEVIALAKAASRNNGRYDSHIRNPTTGLLASIEECLMIAREAGVAAHPAHLKAVGGENFGKAPAIVALIDEARAEGHYVTADVYPYDGAAARSLVAILVPPIDWPVAKTIALSADPELSDAVRDKLIHRITNEWQQVLADPILREAARKTTETPPPSVFSWVNAVGYSALRIVISETKEFEGRMVTELATELGQSPFDLFADLVMKEGGYAKVTLGAIQEADVQHLIRQPWVMISSDGRDGGFEGGAGHPRFRGSFPRILGRYVREWQVLSLEEAVRKMTSLPAAYLRLQDRGVIREGAVADLTVFDPDNIIDQSTWAEPSLYSTGIIHVLVNGQFALRNELMTGEAHGKFLPFSPKTQTTH